MRWTSCLFLLLLVLLGSFFVLHAEAGTETRYFRHDEVLGLSQSSGDDMREAFLAGSKTVYWGVKVYKVDSASSTTEITSGVYQVCLRSANGEGLQSGTWACPQTALASTDHVRVEVYFKFGTGSYALQVTFNSEDLGVTQLDSATWTFYLYTYRYYDSVIKETAMDFEYGVNSGDSKITNFVTSTAASGSWHSVTWTFNLATRQWLPLYWNLGLQTRQWNSLSWTWNLITRAWSSQTWTFELGSKLWTHTLWAFNLLSRGWNSQSWTFDLLSRMWNPQYFTLDLFTRGWNSQSWTFELFARGWNSESWTFDLITRAWHSQPWTFDLLARAWSHQFWSFDFIQKEWTHAYWFFNINARQWNMQDWNFEFAEAFNPGMPGLLLLGILAVIAVIIIAYKHPHIPINL